MSVVANAVPFVMSLLVVEIVVTGVGGCVGCSDDGGGGGVGGVGGGGDGAMSAGVGVVGRWLWRRGSQVLFQLVVDGMGVVVEGGLLYVVVLTAGEVGVAGCGPEGASVLLGVGVGGHSGCGVAVVAACW